MRTEKLLKNPCDLSLTDDIEIQHDSRECRNTRAYKISSS